MTGLELAAVISVCLTALLITVVWALVRAAQSTPNTPPEASDGPYEGGRSS